MKARNPNAARKPPVPSYSRADIDDYVKVKTLEEAQAPEMNAWIEQASRVPGWK